MPNPDGTVPRQIIDSRGRHTTVHVNLDKSNGTVPPLRLTGIRPYMPTNTTEQVEAKQLVYINDLSYDLKSAFPGAVSFEISKWQGEPIINRVLDADGKDIERNFDYGADAMEAFDRSLRVIDYSYGKTQGYISALETNNHNSLYSVDLNKVDALVTEHNPAS